MQESDAITSRRRRCHEIYFTTQRGHPVSVSQREYIDHTDYGCSFQPPAIVHQVYTPVPSFFRGSSFWMLETLHLTRIGREVDAQFGNFTTNVDHIDSEVYRSMVRLALALPFTSTQGFLLLLALFPVLTI